MMASGREKREKAGEKLKDIIESLKGPKTTKTDIETSNDSATASGESDGEFLAIHSLRFIKIFPTFPSYML
jgi:hypothetical protein